MTSLENEERSQHTSHHYRDDLRAFELYWARANPGVPLLPADVTEQDLRDWKGALKSEPIDEAGIRFRKPATVNAKLAAMKSFMAWCERKDVITRMPAPPRPEQLGTRAVKWLSPEEQRKLLREAARHGPRTLAIGRVLIETGLRLAELVALRRKDVTISERKGKIEVREGKGRKPRTIPLNQEARHALESMLGPALTPGPDDPVFASQRRGPNGRRQPLSGRGVQEVLDRLNDRLGWEELHPHLLRHTFGMNLRRAGVDWPVIAKLMGHTSIVTTMTHYGTPSDRDLVNAVDPDAQNGD